jgi:hypothetical protein
MLARRQPYMNSAASVAAISSTLFIWLFPFIGHNTAAPQTSGGPTGSCTVASRDAAGFSAEIAPARASLKMACRPLFLARARTPPQATMAHVASSVTAGHAAPRGPYSAAYRLMVPKFAKLPSGGPE